MREGKFVEVVFHIYGKESKMRNDNKQHQKSSNFRKGIVAGFDYIAFTS